MTVHDGLLLDADLSSSKTYWGLVGGFLLTVVMLSWLLGMVWWQLLVLCVVFFFLLWTSQHKATPIHLAQLPNLTTWQLLMSTSQGEQLWQAKLKSARMYRFGVWLNFEVCEPLTTNLKFWLFFDQLSDEDRRKLKMAIKFF